MGFIAPLWKPLLTPIPFLTAYVITFVLFSAPSPTSWMTASNPAPQAPLSAGKPPVVFVTSTRFSAEISPPVDPPSPRRRTRKPNSPKIPQRVAVCFAGNARTFHYPFVYNNLHENVIGPLRRNGHTVDIFFVMRVDDDPRLHAAAVANEDATLSAVRTFDAKVVNIIRARDEFATKTRWFRYNNSELHAPPEKCARDGLSREKAAARFPHTLYRARQCLGAIEGEERRVGMKYDWIYRLRPDTVFLDEVPQPHEMRNDTAYSNQARHGTSRWVSAWWAKTRNTKTVGYGPIADQLTMSSREIASVLLRAFNVLEDCDAYRVPVETPPENLLRLWLLKRGIRYKATPFGWATVLERDGPTCDKLLYLYGEDLRGERVDWVKVMTQCRRFANAVREFFEDMPPMPTDEEEMRRLNAMRMEFMNRVVWSGKM